MNDAIRWAMVSPPGEWVTRRINKLLLDALSYGPVPQHAAFVMDGNRRYARHRGIETLEGHSQGFISFGRVLAMSYLLGIKVVTVYAFAIANFNRSRYEVDGLLEMAKVKLEELAQEGDVLERYGARLRVIGERHMIRKDVLECVERIEEMTKNNTDAVLNICFPYGSHEEITAAIRGTVEEHMSPPAPQRAMFSQSRISRGIMTRQHPSSLPTIRDASPASPPCADTNGGSSPTLGPGSSPDSCASNDDYLAFNTDAITVESLERHMYTNQDPPVDLFVRTSGVERMSDFLTWQCHQDTHIVFTKTLWPDFGMHDFVPIILEWQLLKRKRENKEASLAWKSA